MKTLFLLILFISATGLGNELHKNLNPSEQQTDPRPTFTTQLKDAQFKEGDTVYLEVRCEPSRDATLRYEVYFNGKLIKSGRKYIINFDFGYLSLTIKDIQMEDAGIYSFKIYNQHGEAVTSAKLTVTER